MKQGSTIDFPTDAGIITFVDKVAQRVQFLTDTKIVIIRKSKWKAVSSNQKIEFPKDSSIQVEKGISIKFDFNSEISFEEAILYKKTARKRKDNFNWQISSQADTKRRSNYTNDPQKTLHKTRKGPIKFIPTDRLKFQHSMIITAQSSTVVTFLGTSLYLEIAPLLKWFLFSEKRPAHLTEGETIILSPDDYIRIGGITSPVHLPPSTPTTVPSQTKFNFKSTSV